MASDRAGVPLEIRFDLMRSRLWSVIAALAMAGLAVPALATASISTAVRPALIRVLASSPAGRTPAPSSLPSRHAPGRTPGRALPSHAPVARKLTPTHGRTRAGHALAANPNPYPIQRTQAGLRVRVANESAPRVMRRRVESERGPPRGSPFATLRPRNSVSAALRRPTVNPPVLAARAALPSPRAAVDSTPISTIPIPSPGRVPPERCVVVSAPEFSGRETAHACAVPRARQRRVWGPRSLGGLT